MLVDPHEKPVQYAQIMESPGQIVSYCPSMVSPFVAEALMKFRHVGWARVPYGGQKGSHERRSGHAD